MRPLSKKENLDSITPAAANIVANSRFARGTAADSTVLKGANSPND
jgi:hypothetical protein